MQGQKRLRPAKDLLCRGQGIDQGGVPAPAGSSPGKRAAESAAADHLRHRHPGLGAALFYGGGAPPGGGHCGLQEQDPDNPDPRQAKEDAAAVCRPKGDPQRSGVRHQDGQAPGPQQYLVGHEKAL